MQRIFTKKLILKFLYEALKYLSLSDFSYFENIEKMQRLPRPISFEMGAVDYLEAGSFDQLLYISNKINDLT